MLRFWVRATPTDPEKGRRAPTADADDGEEDEDDDDDEARRFW